ncbi:MAG: TonB-dependent receptor plug domain-containing protein [Vitreoscilla sp.]
MSSRHPGPIAPVHSRVAAFPLTTVVAALALLGANSALAQSASDASQEVVVTAARVPQKLPDTLPSTVVISRADIEASPALDVPDLMRGFLSFNVAQTGPVGAQTSIFVRGANSNQVLVLVDGAPLSRADFGSAPWELVPLSQVDHIEVVRGNLSSLYGSAAVGGVVQIFTKHGAGTSLTVGGGSRGTLTGSASVGRRYGAEDRALDLSASISGIHTDGYSARDAKVDPTVNPDRDASTQSGETLAVAKTWATGHRTTFSAMHSDTDSHYDGYNGPTVVDELKSRLDNLTLTSHHALTPSLDLDLHAGEDVIKYTDPTAYTPGGLGRTRLLGVGVEWTVADGQNLQFGYENDSERFGYEAATPSRRHTNSVRAGWLGAFGPAFEVQANVRHDDASDYGVANTGLLSLGWRLDREWKLVAQASTAFSAPSFSNIAYEAAPLKAEHSRDFELGVHWNRGSWLARATLFSQRQHDLIAFDANFETLNIAHASNRGLELSLSGDTGYGKVGLDATFQDARDDDAHTALLRRARTVVAANYRVPVAGWDTGVWLQYTGPRADGDPITFATVKARARTVLGLTASHALSPNWAIGVKAGNLTGKHAPEVLGYTPPPPLVLVSLHGQWQ